SDPPKAHQSLEGLVRIQGKAAKVSVESNRLKIFPKSRLEGPITVQLEAGLLSQLGQKLAEPILESLTFEEAKPKVRMVGKGTILPRSESMPLVFESIGLNAVDVRVIKIYEKNIPQFLQINQLDGHSELKRVGQVVATSRVALEGDMTTWNRHALDLSTIMEPDPGSLYEIALGFRKSYTTYDCEEGNTGDSNSMLEVGADWFTFTEANDNSNWDYWEEEYAYGYQADPCYHAYYHPGRMARRNVLASDLGLIAKQGDAGAMFIATNLKTTQPESGVELAIYDYQHQLINTLQTDDKGMVRSNLDRTPYLLIAQKGNQRGYLRLDDGSSLSMSRFDTQGKTYHKGVKGFLYAERGVWRPGDQMYINFILEDRNEQLPPDHPVRFELKDPRGQLVQRVVQTQGTQGFYPFHVATSPDAATGNYLAEVQVGGAKFSRVFKVETIIPNRLKMALDFGVKALSEKTYNQTATLNAKWLHGAVANQLKADVQVSLQSGSTAFPRYSEFTFEDPVRKFYGEEITLFDGQLDASGNASIPAKISVEDDAPGQLVAHFKTKVFEPGGAFSVDRFSIPYHPYPTYVGLRTPKGDAARGMLLTDVDHSVEIATLTPEGKPVSSSVEVTLYKLSWKWWWDKTEDNIGTYDGTVDAEELQSATVSTTNGKGTWNMRVDYPSWGRYLVRAVDQNGHATGKIIYIDWPGWAGRSTEREGGGAQMLNFTSDKKLYEVGESVTLNIPTGEAGRALVTVESGNRVLDAYWVDATKGTTRFSFPSTPAMSPNAYVHVSLLQPHAQTKNDLPIRMYGVIPIKVEDPKTHLRPNIAVANELKPNAGFEVKVSEASGQAMTYTVAVVDEGLLGLTRHKAEDPWQTFYQRQALNVKTWDLFDQVLGAYGGEIRSLLSIGGGAEAEGPKGQKANRFKPVVMHLGPFELKADETQTHRLQMPNYIGAVRTMVIAGNPTGAYGAAEKSSTVKQPLMVLGTLPRVLGPGERLSLPVTVFALEEEIKLVNVSVTTGSSVMVEGKESQTVRFNAIGEQMTNFDLGVLSKLGPTPIKIIAKSGSHQAVYETEIEVRNPNPRISKQYAQTVAGKGNWKQAISPIGVRGTNGLAFEVSTLPPMNLGKRLSYLMRYPYGCIEQTTSSVFPQVYLSNLMELPQQQQLQIDKNLRAGIQRLKLFQTSSGGFAYWPGQSQVNEWGTNHAGHYLLAAQQAGYSLPDGLINSWSSYQTEKANGWSGDKRAEEQTQAYRLFLLAMAGKPAMGAMNRLLQHKNLPTSVRWQLAAAYQLAGQSQTAQRISRELGTTVQEYQELSGTYGSGLRDRAIVLEAMSILNQRDRATALVQQISNKLASDDGLSTQSTAYSLVAMAQYAGKAGSQTNMKFSYRLSGGSWEDVNTAKPYFQFTSSEVKKGEVSFKNKTGVPLYPRVVLDGVPLEGDTSKAAYGLQLSVIYTDMEDRFMRPTQLQQGTDFRAKVVVKNTGNRDYFELALDQIFPSGWEIHNLRLDGSDAAGDVPEYQDIRDDRVYTFFDLKKGESKSFSVLLNAAYLGRYYLPSIKAEAMYDHRIHAHLPGQWVVVEE
ncbi:MAG: MG2 domain-containing protein, partial [Bacteroidota bacterium]